MNSLQSEQYDHPIPLNFQTESRRLYAFLDIEPSIAKEASPPNIDFDTLLATCYHHIDAISWALRTAQEGKV